MFTTASGKPSHVSAAGLRKAAKLFNGPDVCGYAENGKLSNGQATPGDDTGDAISDMLTNRNELSIIPEATFAKDSRFNPGDCNTASLAEARHAYSDITSESDSLHTSFESGSGASIAHSESSIQNGKSDSVLTGLRHIEVAVKTSKRPISKMSTLFTASTVTRAKDKRGKRREDDEGEEVTSKNRDRDTSSSLQNEMPLKRQKRRFFTPMQKLEPNLHPSSAVHGPSLSTSPYVHICSQEGPSAKRAKLHSLFLETWQQPRKTLEECFEDWGCLKGRCTGKQVLKMTPDSAQNFKFSESSDPVGPAEMRMKLLEAGANPKEASPRWVENHYRWIVWKLASHERIGGTNLGADRVLDELKYRYEREVNRGSRSALKRVAEKDALSRREMVVCISAVNPGGQMGDRTVGQYGRGVQPDSDVNGEEVPHSGTQPLAKIEVTDGWYWLPAHLDTNLSRLLHSGKLFVGQKIKVSGASLQGCEEGLPPLDVKDLIAPRHLPASRIQSRGPPQPLYLGCISSTGGQVPLTAVAILRTYPILYREKVGNGGVTRSARAEDVALRQYEERRGKVAEEVAQKFEGVRCSSSKRKHGEGARLAAALEGSADPEMREEQERALLLHQEREQEWRRGVVEAALKEALEAEGLGPRDVCPLLRIRVASLLSPQMQHRVAQGKQRQVEGMISIWRPSEEQMEEVEGGGMFLVSALQPTLHSTATLLSFNTTRSTRWRRISEQAGRQLSCCTQPRKAAPITDLHLLPTQSEFDVVGWVVRVGLPFTTASRVRQWTFLAEEGNGVEMGILAIEFSGFAEGFVPLAEALSGTVIGWSGLLLKARDEGNGIEIGEATDAAQLYTSFGSKGATHMGEAAAATKEWIGNASEVRDLLRTRVDDILKRNP